MFRKKLSCFAILLAGFCFLCVGCQATVDSVDQSDKWLDDELHRHM